MILEWEYKPFDWNELNEMNLKNYINSVKSGVTALIGQDNAIIAIGFGQFVLEGKIDGELKALTKMAINRELLPALIERWEGDYKNTRTEQLTKMLSVVDKMNEE